jgi:hypothetical protein
VTNLRTNGHPKKSTRDQAVGIRSDFDFEIVEVNGRDAIIIQDLNKGRMSVTNDIENVVAYIAKLNDLDPASYLIVYRDSEGTWDGWDAKRRDFVALGEQAFEGAISRLTEKKLQ